MPSSSILVASGNELEWDQGSRVSLSKFTNNINELKSKDLIKPKVRRKNSATNRLLASLPNLVNAFKIGRRSYQPIAYQRNRNPGSVVLPPNGSVPDSLYSYSANDVREPNSAPSSARIKNQSNRRDKHMSWCYTNADTPAFESNRLQYARKQSLANSSYDDIEKDSLMDSSSTIYNINNENNSIPKSSAHRQPQPNGHYKSAVESSINSNRSHIDVSENLPPANRVYAVRRLLSSEAAIPKPRRNIEQPPHRLPPKVNDRRPLEDHLTNHHSNKSQSFSSGNPLEADDSSGVTHYSISKTIVAGNDVEVTKIMNENAALKSKVAAQKRSISELESKLKQSKDEYNLLKEKMAQQYVETNLLLKQQQTKYASSTASYNDSLNAPVNHHESASQVASLSCELEKLRKHLRAQKDIYVNERKGWVQEKQLVLKYQRQLQQSYLKLSTENEALHKKLQYQKYCTNL